MSPCFIRDKCNLSCIKSARNKKNDEVICPVISWVATANAISMLGAKPIFVDVNLDQNINADLVEKITKKLKL